MICICLQDGCDKAATCLSCTNKYCLFHVPPISHFSMGSYRKAVDIFLTRGALLFCIALSTAHAIEKQNTLWKAACAADRCTLIHVVTSNPSCFLSLAFSSGYRNGDTGNIAGMIGNQITDQIRYLIQMARSSQRYRGFVVFKELLRSGVDIPAATVCLCSIFFLSLIHI